MCGIAGIVGLTNITDQLFRCVKNLEYRGYDSCGMALITDNKIIIKKNIGTVDKVNKLEHLTEQSSKIGLAHTRWATHGGVTKDNSHPHFGCDRTFAVVHNGIISNYRILKAKLIESGHTFNSETDTEVIPHLLEETYKEEGSVERAIQKTFNQLEGTYAFAFITTHDPENIYCARIDSPLVLGIGSDRIFLASDTNSFIEYTQDIIILNNYEYAIISDDSYTIKDLRSGDRINRETQRISWTPGSTDKGGFPTYMLKEIHEQPVTVKTALNIEQNKIKKLANMINQQEKTYLVGVGTTYYVSLIAQYYFSKLAKKYIPAVASDEFEYLAEVNNKTLFLCSSQSGETYDTLKALRFAKGGGALSASIVNVPGSSISRETDFTIMQGSGPEICVLSTKTALAQITILLRIVIELGKLNGSISPSQYKKHKEHLEEIPDAIQWVLDHRMSVIREVSNSCFHIKNWLFLGRGIYMATAMEAALKMKEVTYLHAEGMAGGFMKHGTISLIDKDTYTLVLVPPEKEKELFKATMNNVEEVKARNGFVVGLHYGKEQSFFDKEIIFDKVPPLIAPLQELIAAQLFAYYSAVSLGRNIDKPRSLAKSVTVA